MKNILVGDIVNKEAFTIKIHQNIHEAAHIISRSQASDLMVIDEEQIFFGVLSEGDLIRALVPAFDELIYSAERTLPDACKIFLKTAEDMANQTIDRLIIRNCITLRPDDELLKAAIVMVTKNIHRLPVVYQKKFIGTISRADICQALLDI